MSAVKTILVTGGRNYYDKEVIHATLKELDRQHGITTLIHGGASGADTIAGAWAKEQGITVWVYPADWAKYGKAAGPMRNRDMLTRGKPDLVVAFEGGRGTANMIKQAREAGILVLEAKCV